MFPEPRVPRDYCHHYHHHNHSKQLTNTFISSTKYRKCKPNVACRDSRPPRCIVGRKRLTLHIYLGVKFGELLFIQMSLCVHAPLVAKLQIQKAQHRLSLSATENITT